MKQLFQFFQKPGLFTDLAGAGLILFGTFCVSKIIFWIEKIIRIRLVKRTKTDLDDKITRLLGHGIRNLVWLGGIFLLIHNLDSVFPAESQTVTIVDGALYILLVLVIAHLVSSLLRTLLDWYGDNWGKQTKGRLQEEFRPLFRKIIIIVVYVIAMIQILKHFNQDFNSILVSLGVGSLAVALAAKDTLANMIAGFMIMTDRPFRMGDRILLESGEKGDVYDIGLRTTKILTFDNTLVVVPNQQIINEKVTNLSYPNPQIRVTVEVGVAYGTNLDKVKTLLEQICQEHSKVLEDPPPKAYFLNFGNSSLDLKVVCRVRVWGEQWSVAEEIRMEIYRRFEREGIEIPFPQRVVWMKKEG